MADLAMWLFQHIQEAAQIVLALLGGSALGFPVWLNRVAAVAPQALSALDARLVSCNPVPDHAGRAAAAILWPRGLSLAETTKPPVRVRGASGRSYWPVDIRMM
jgi:hypothetical protein